MRNREEAARAAEATNFNKPDTCQLQTRLWFDAPSVGDLDGDGSADAEDGWKSEPVGKRHTDRNPPRGTPVSYLGGSNDNGHRAISLGNGKIRSTDAPTRGRTSTVSLDWPEKQWGLKYVGWSETMDGLPIPLPEYEPRTRGEGVDEAINRIRRAARHAKDGTQRDTLLNRALGTLRKIPFRPRRLK